MRATTRSRRRPRGDDGAAAVELALVILPLLLIVFGIVDFGRAFSMQITVTHAAMEGARVLAVGGSTADAELRTREAAFPVTGLVVTASGCPATVTPTTPPARVGITRTYDYVTPISAITSLLGSSLATPIITGRGEMRCGG